MIGRANETTSWATERPNKDITSGINIKIQNQFIKVKHGYQE